MAMDLTLAVPQYLRENGKEKLAGHVQRVAREARRIAEREGVDPAAAEAAGWLHDISLVLPYAEMLGVARAKGLVVLPEEEQAPALLVPGGLCRALACYSRSPAIKLGCCRRNCSSATCGTMRRIWPSWTRERRALSRDSLIGLWTIQSAINP